MMKSEINREEGEDMLDGIIILALVGLCVLGINLMKHLDFRHWMTK